MAFNDIRATPLMTSAIKDCLMTGRRKFRVIFSYPLCFARPPNFGGQKFTELYTIYISSPKFRGGAHRAEGPVI